MAPIHYDLFWQDYFDYCELPNPKLENEFA